MRKKRKGYAEGGYVNRDADVRMGTGRSRAFDTPVDLTPAKADQRAENTVGKARGGKVRKVLMRGKR